MYAEADRRLVNAATDVFRKLGLLAYVGSSWTTDAPFREMEAAVAAARAKGVLAVKMEAAALYAFTRLAGNPALSLAHVTNTMGLADKDFEKGEAQGARDALRILDALCKSLRSDGDSFAGWRVSPESH